MKILGTLLTFTLLFFSTSVLEGHALSPQERLAEVFPHQVISDVKPLEGGKSGVPTYTFEMGNKSYVAKFENKANKRANMNTFGVMQDASDKGVAPHVKYAGLENGIVVMEKIDNKMEEFFDLPKKERVRLLEELMERMKQIKTTKEATPTLKILKRRLKRIEKNWGCLPQNLQQAVAELDLEAEEPPRESFVHNDFHYGNILYDGERLWAIDFTDSGVGDPLYDLASIINYTEPTEAHIKEMLTAHLGRTPNGADFEHLRSLRKRHSVYAALQLLHGIKQPDIKSCTLPTPWAQPLPEATADFIKGDLDISNQETSLKIGNAFIEQALKL